MRSCRLRRGGKSGRWPRPRRPEGGGEEREGNGAHGSRGKRDWEVAISVRWRQEQGREVRRPSRDRQARRQERANQGPQWQARGDREAYQRSPLPRTSATSVPSLVRSVLAAAQNQANIARSGQNVSASGLARSAASPGWPWYMRTTAMGPCPKMSRSGSPSTSPQWSALPGESLGVTESARPHRPACLGEGDPPAQ